MPLKVISLVFILCYVTRFNAGKCLESVYLHLTEMFKKLKFSATKEFTEN